MMVSHSLHPILNIKFQIILFSVLLLALLSRSVQTLLTQYMDYERQQLSGKCQTKSLFLRTCYDKVHWIGTLLEGGNDDAIRALNHKVYHHLRLFRLILKLGSYSYDDTSWHSDLDAIDATVVESESALELCLIELTRQKHVFKFLNSHHHVGHFDNKMLVNNNIMNNLLALQVDFSSVNYGEVRKLLELNLELNERQLQISLISPEVSRTEVELLKEYMIIKLYLNLIQSNDATQERIEEQLQQIRILIKTINDGKILFQLMQNIFTLVFLRFEHIRKTKRKRKNSEIQSGSFSNHNNSQTTDVSDTTVDTLLTGFVCLRTSLKAILNSMRLFLMALDQREVYRVCDDALKEKFVKMLKDVDNTLWRLQMIDSEGQKKLKSIQSVKEWIKHYDTDNVKAFKVQLEITSEDEQKMPKKKVYRKKLRKRLKIAPQTDGNDEASDDPIEFQLATETSLTENSENRTQSRSTESQRRVRSIVSKLLIDPESLVTICLLKNDDENVQKVIQVSCDSSSISGNVFMIFFNRITSFKTLKLPTR